MHPNSCFRVNQPAVIGEIIDGEAIIVNLDSGAYYSLRDSGAIIWNLIEQGATLSQVIEQMAKQYNGPVKAIEVGVNALIAELQAENLIIPQDSLSSPAVIAETVNGERLPFQKPVLEKFTDMADLLLLDPIHEVDEMGGWPHPAPATS